MIQCAILGYGKMGKEVEKILRQQSIAISAIIDTEEDWKTHLAAFQQSDIAIDFSTPATVVENMKRCLTHSVPVVVGTTGWLDSLTEIETLCAQNSGALLYGSNFSVGANFLFALCRQAAAMLAPAGYSAAIEESHHIHKKDKPSGTALTIEEALRTTYQPPTQIPIQSIREGDIKGEHTITFSSAHDTITLSHSVNDRALFAQGAVQAAIWLLENRGFHRFENIVIDLFKDKNNR